MIRFTVNAIPIAQPRQRHRVLTAGGRTFAQNYTPAKHPVQDFKASVRMAFAAVYSGAPIEGAIVLRVVFLFPRPGRLRWKSKPMPRSQHVAKPDLDNAIKSIKDSLKSLAWNDDSQVQRFEAEKWYASGSEQPSVEVEIDRA